MLFERKEFISHAGQKLDWKIECDNLSDEDIETCAWLIAQKYSFKGVVGVPRGGLRLANALVKYISKESNIILLVDDVYTTGKSMQDSLNKLKDYGKYVIGVVIFARKEPTLPWVKSLFKYTF